MTGTGKSTQELVDYRKEIRNRSSNGNLGNKKDWSESERVDKSQ